MIKIATLGPAGTFSDVAAQRYAQSFNEVVEVVYFSHLQRVLMATGQGCDFALVPIENVSEGFVPVVLDHLVNADLHIVSEFNLDIAFDCIGQVDKKTDIQRLFVQFVARGQCRDFISSLGDIELVATESNVESLQRAEAEPGAAAIIPSHIAANKRSSWSQSGVHDYAHNQTRFLVLSDNPNRMGGGTKTSLLVINEADRPGLLEQVLHCFSTRKLNLTSIVSRPTGEGFGKYHFFMDVEGSLSDIAMRGALKSVSQIARLKVLGNYNSL
ncbi:prephenate dehydratase [Aliidiomarina minuta]|uniref:prephenate dehydratase n=1 Tax=Aliidiomarina minuta TaxID=880057 RepID=A0A432W9Z0_9GAMM|nr:prephenate dehydratase domain-containing protein [Aliidiomarina minuta]RUO26929.1 prephenate dehydratase [Aliidiomarina minuta]